MKIPCAVIREKVERKHTQIRCFGCLMDNTYTIYLADVGC